jgi:N-acetylglucosamine-6-phosphate deacetylase
LSKDQLGYRLASPGRRQVFQGSDVKATIRYVDLQVNGYVGVDFNDPNTTLEQLQFAADAMQRDGVVAALPTIITADLFVMCACITKLAEFIHNQPASQRFFKGVHIEGPFFPARPGFIGAHPPQFVQPASESALLKLLDSAQGLARLVTLAPEVDVNGALTEICVARGCAVAAGHTDASVIDLNRCIDVGLTLFTHLANGCPRQLDRHDNIIYRALSLQDKLAFSLIADGFHVPELLFRNLLSWVNHDRLCVVSDAISATGLGPGVYRLGQRSVTIGADKAARDPSGEHFVGAASSMADADRWLENCLGLAHGLRTQLLSTNPSKFCNLGV